MLALVEVFDLFGYGIFELIPALVIPYIAEMHDIRVTLGGGRGECEWVEVIDFLVRESFITFVPGEECMQG